MPVCGTCDDKGTHPMACPSCGREGSLRAEVLPDLSSALVPCPRMPGGPLFSEYHKAKCPTCKGKQFVRVVYRIHHSEKNRVDLTRPLNRFEDRAALKKVKKVTQRDVDKALN